MVGKKHIDDGSINGVEVDCCECGCGKWFGYQDHEKMLEFERLHFKAKELEEEAIELRLQAANLFTGVAKLDNGEIILFEVGEYYKWPKE